MCCEDVTINFPIGGHCNFYYNFLGSFTAYKCSLHSHLVYTIHETATPNSPIGQSNLTASFQQELAVYLT